MTTSSPAEAKKTPATIPSEGEACPNCGSMKPWSGASWCPDCGFYPALGGTSLRSAEDVEANGGASNLAPWESPDNGPANLIEAIPPWGWLALGGTLLIVLINFGARVIFPLKPSQRTFFTLIEFSIGILTAGLAHLSAYLFAACKSDKYGPFDFFMKPIDIWKPTFKKMSEGARRVCSMVWGTTAILAALFIMSGFDFNAMFDDWGFEKREKTSLVKEAVKHARTRRKGNEDLESAVNELVAEGELEDELPVLLETQCVIIGYTTTDMGELASVILASAPRGRLSYVGLLSQADVPEESREELLMELQDANELKSSYVKRDVPLKNANWVAPTVLCLVEHKAWTSQYHLQQPKFLKIVVPEEPTEETP